MAPKKVFTETPGKPYTELPSCCWGVLEGYSGWRLGTLQTSAKATPGLGPMSSQIEFGDSLKAFAGSVYGGLWADPPPRLYWAVLGIHANDLDLAFGRRLLSLPENTQTLDS